jgi:hypothetical protein
VRPAEVRRSLNLILLDNGAGLVLDVIRFVVLAVLIVARLLRYIRIGRQLGTGPHVGMFICFALEALPHTRSVNTINLDG